jgi:hypothetical protein
MAYNGNVDENKPILRVLLAFQPYLEPTRIAYKRFLNVL